MTLNLTVLTQRCIYQCADYRMINPITRQPYNDQAQKIVLVNAANWNTTNYLMVHKRDIEGAEREFRKAIDKARARSNSPAVRRSGITMEWGLWESP